MLTQWLRQQGEQAFIVNSMVTATRRTSI